jgi:TPR repeat protein
VAVEAAVVAEAVAEAVAAGNGTTGGAPAMRLRRALLLSAAMLAWSIADALDASAWADGRRVALIVGNGAYVGLPPLANPGADARLLADTLEARGFEVQLALDVDRSGLLAALARFKVAAVGADVAMFYYSGHGVQIEGVNYLLPISTRVATRGDLDQEALTLPAVLNSLEEAGASLGIVVVDACRDNPLSDLAPAPMTTRSVVPRTGLARMPVERGMMIAYATAPGQVALDGPPGQNSPFAAALAHFLTRPGLEIGILFRKVSERVREVTGGAQVPWTEAALTGDDIYLFPPDAAPAAPLGGAEALNTALAVDDRAARQLALRQFLANGPDASLASVARAYLDRLAADEMERRRLATATVEDALADWQLVQTLRETAAEPLGIEAFLAVHPAGELAQRAAARLAELPGRPLPPPEGAAAVLWPLVELAGRPEDFARFTALFPGSEEARQAQDRLAIARAEPRQPVPATAAPAAASPLVVESYVGTGPTPIDVPGLPVMVAVIRPPLYGALTGPGLRGLSPAVGSEPVLVQQLAYEPDIEARDVVDNVILAVGEAAQGREVAVQVHIAVHECDRLAGARFDTQGVVKGNYTNEIGAAAAIAACEEARESFPDVPRFAYELGRAQEAAGDHAQAAGELERADEAYTLAAGLYDEAAAAGHVVALSGLGGLHEEGKGVPVDADRAVAFYEAAAAENDPLAMNALARAYRDGEGKPKDRELAVQWFLKAAAHGHTFAYNNLGYLLAGEGRGDQAIVLFRASAEAGDIYGFNNMGYAYENGVGVEQDIHQAIAWYERAAAGGQPNAPVNLGFIYRDGRPGLDPDPAQAARWFAQAARLGAGWGYIHLAGLYASGQLGQAADPALAARILARAAMVDEGEAGLAARQAFAGLPARAQVAALQGALQQGGYDVGPIDGLPGARTQGAIEAYLAERGSPVPGQGQPIDLLGALLSPDPAALP